MALWRWDKVREPRLLHLTHASLIPITPPPPSHLLIAPLTYIFSSLSVPPPIPDLLLNHQCAGNEAEVAARCEYLKDQWENLEARTHQKTQKLKEANQEQQFNTGVKDMDFWLDDVCVCMYTHTRTHTHAHICAQTTCWYWY